MWPKIDDEHSHCQKCNVGFRNAELTRGLCSECSMTQEETNTKVLARSQNKTVTKAATKFLAAMKEQGRTGASMPKAFEGFWRTIGGEDKFGEMMGEQFMRVQGHNLSPEEEETFELSDRTVLAWFEMINRHAAKTDEGKTLDVGSLDEADLESILSSLALKALQEDQATRMTAVSSLVRSRESRREIFLMCLEEEPGLATEVLEANGIYTIDAVNVSIPKKSPEQNITVEGEDSPGVEPEYDPAADELKP